MLGVAWTSRAREHGFSSRGHADGRMQPHAAFTILGLGAGWVILVAALLVLYLWFCVYWWRGGRPVAGRSEPEADSRRERTRRRAARPTPGRPAQPGHGRPAGHAPAPPPPPPPAP